MAMQLKVEMKDRSSQPVYTSKSVPEVIVPLHQMKYENFTRSFLHNITIQTLACSWSPKNHRV